MSKQEKLFVKDNELVFIPKNTSELAVAKSILNGSAIKYYIKNENVQHLYGMGTMGSGFNTLMGPVEICMDKNEKDEIYALFAQFLS